MTLERVLGSALAGLGATLFMEQDVELEVVPQGVTRAQPEELFVSFPAVATTTPPTSPARSAARPLPMAARTSTSEHAYGRA